MVCNNCENKDLCKYVDLIEKVNEELKGTPVCISCSKMKQNKTQFIQTQQTKSELQIEEYDSKLVCPICGSTNIEEDWTIHIENTGLFSFDIISGGYICEDCGCEFGQKRKHNNIFF